MKKIVAIIVLLALSLTMFIGNVSAETENDDFTYEVVDEKAVITQYTGNDVEVSIPSTLGGFPVTKIRNGAFLWETKVESIAIPASIVEIEPWWLGGKDRPNTSQLKNISVDPDNPAYSSLEGVLFNNEKTKLLKYPLNKEDRKYTIPEGVETISKDSFSHVQKTKHIVMPDSVKTLGNKAFFVSRIKSVYISKSITKIPKLAFGGCENLRKVRGAEQVRSIGNYAFGDCVILKKLPLGPKLKTIGKGTFTGSRVEKLYIPKGVTKIKNRAFWGCEFLRKVSINKKLKSIGTSAFENCTALKKVKIPKNVDSIGKHAFDISLFKDNGKLRYYSKVKLLCIKGSTAHKYAKKNNISYKLIS